MKTKLQTKAASVEAFLKQELTHASNQEHLREIMEYAVTNGGKRLRPILLLASYELFEEDSTKAVPYAAALEMIHSYSLVHDDLPAMDNDDLRRGKPTCHKQFSEFGAILAGDALLNLSFETMLRYAGNFPAETALRGMTYIANASGAKGMCAGQMSDMEQSATDFQSIAQMHRNKTGAFDYSKFHGDERKYIKGLAKSGNAAVVVLDGKLYFSHSAVETEGTMVHDSYAGEHPLVGFSNKRIFKTLDLKDGVLRQYDTEAKFLEYVASIKTDRSEAFEVTILSEKHICKSCEYVVEQFKKLFPNATVNIVSGNPNYGDVNSKGEHGMKTWQHRKD